MGYGVLLLGIGSFVFATPHLTSGLYQVFFYRMKLKIHVFKLTTCCAQASVKEQVINTCSLSQSSMNASCSTSDQLTAGLAGGWALQKFKYVFLVAQLIMGAGGAPLYTLGTAFIDENVSYF